MLSEMVRNCHNVHLSCIKILSPKPHTLRAGPPGHRSTVLSNWLFPLVQIPILVSSEMSASSSTSSAKLWQRPPIGQSHSICWETLTLPTVSKSEFALSSLAGSPVEALGTNANPNLPTSSTFYQRLPTSGYPLLPTSTM